MNKNDLIKEAAARAGVPAETARRVIEKSLGIIGDRLAEGNKVIIKDFGTFDTYMAAERKARVPGTGDEVTVPARKRVRFRAHKGIGVYSEKNL